MSLMGKYVHMTSMEVEDWHARLVPKDIEWPLNIFVGVTWEYQVHK